MQYIGTKIVKAEPMTRAQYNTFRGWNLPLDEDGSDAGYLVEYLDGGKPNVATHAGYVSWSPAEQFNAAYIQMPEGSEKFPPHQQRVFAEKSSLDDKVEKLDKFVYTSNVFHGLDEDEKNRLIAQLLAMQNYSEILADRIANFI